MLASEIDCKWKDKTPRHAVLCLKQTALCGFRRSVHADLCGQCLKEGGNKTDVADTPLMRRMVKGGLEARLTAGTLPRYQDANPVDMDAAFAKFAAVATDYEKAELVRRMIYNQSQFTPERGGKEPAVLADELLALADKFGVRTAVEDAIIQIESLPA